jgi:hypothetical protein
MPLALQGHGSLGGLMAVQSHRHGTHECLVWHCLHIDPLWEKKAIGFIHAFDDGNTLIDPHRL